MPMTSTLFLVCPAANVLQNTCIRLTQNTVVGLTPLAAYVLSVFHSVRGPAFGGKIDCHKCSSTDNNNTKCLDPINIEGLKSCNDYMCTKMTVILEGEFY